MNYANAFHLVAKASEKSAVPCILIGGFAMNFYKVSRATLDVDFLITGDDLRKIKGSLADAGYAEDFATDVAVRMANKEERLDIDFMIVDDATRSKIMEDGREVEVVGEKLIIPSIEHLIALKLHAIKGNPKNRMWKDMPDIVNLIKKNGIDAKSEDFRKICLKFFRPGGSLQSALPCSGVSTRIPGASTASSNPS